MILLFWGVNMSEFTFNPFTNKLDQTLSDDHTHSTLTSATAVAGSTITLTSDGTDQTLTGNLGKLNIVPAGGLVLQSNQPDVLSSIAFEFKNNIAQTQASQYIYKMWTNDAVGSTYQTQYKTGEWVTGYGTTQTPLQPLTGYILGFIADTSNHHPSATYPLSCGVTSYIIHKDTGMSVARINGLTGAAIHNGGTIPTHAMAYMGVFSVTGSGTDAASFSGKKLACFAGKFTKVGSLYNGLIQTDWQSNLNTIFGNYDHATIFWADMNAYASRLGSGDPAINRPVIASSARLVIQGMGSSDQCAIYGETIAFYTADKNNVTRRYFARIPFPNTNGATNLAHLWMVATAASAGGYTWAEKGGMYFDDGTNNPLGLYIHDSSSWIRLLTTDKAYPATNGGSSLGLNGYGWSSLILKDTTAAYEATLQFTNTGISADRTLTFDLGDASRTLTLSGNPTLGDWFDQAVKTTSSPIFAGVTVNGDIVLPTVTGIKIGTATNQLLGFYNATPVDQPVTVADAATQDLTGTDTIDRAKTEADLTSCKNAINALTDRLQELGLIGV